MTENGNENAELPEDVREWLEQHPETGWPDQPVWTTAALQRDFTVRGFQAPYVVVVRKSDDKLGSLQFNHRPRVYYGWQEHQE